MHNRNQLLSARDALLNGSRDFSANGILIRSARADIIGIGVHNALTMAFSDKATLPAEPLAKVFCINPKVSPALALSVCHQEQTFLAASGILLDLCDGEVCRSSGLIFDGKKLIFVISQRH